MIRPVLRTIAVQSALMLLLGTYSHAADPWSKKPYGEWTEEDCLKVLSDSPWSQRVFNGGGPAISDPKQRSVSGPKGGGATGPPCSGCAQRTGPVLEDSTYSPGVRPEDSTPATPVMTHQVVWFSSAHVRQALYRLGLIKGVNPDVRVEASLKLPAAEILIAVSSPSLERFQNLDLADLQKSTFLRSRKKRSRQIQPAGFVSPAAREDRLAIFVFARGTEGQPTFDAGDAEVEFSTGEGQNRITARFNLKKMTTGGMLDF
jgi:hypothetical protein